MMSVLKNLSVGCVLAGVSIGSASAQDITFKFNNPSFGGNSFNSGHLLGLAEIQQQHEDPRPVRQQADPVARAQADFLRRLEGQLLNNVTEQVTALIQDGEEVVRTFVAGDQFITVEITLDEAIITTQSLSNPEQVSEVRFQNVNSPAVDAGMMTTLDGG